MPSFSDFGKKISSIAETAGKKSNEMMETARLNNEIAGFEENVSELQFQLGAEYYEQNKEHPEGPFEETIRKILRCEEEIRIRSERLLSLKGMMYCPSCDAVIGMGDGFCSKCGAPLPAVKEEKREDTDLCANCGAPFSKGQAYCNKCGYLVQDDLSI
ncbi:MAG TPA: zinc ribbon domain-containing protein [Feifaniaceae bacterium]|nr:zinc ribbon domain-containing protein [Feifaniaceae bacterium]